MPMNDGRYMMATGEALSDPNPENNMGYDMTVINKDYHLSWGKRGKLVLHSGFAMKCRKAHYDHKGQRFVKPKKEEA
jgi:hypothetical protein